MSLPIRRALGASAALFLLAGCDAATDAAPAAGRAATSVQAERMVMDTPPGVIATAGRAASALTRDTDRELLARVDPATTTTGLPPEPVPTTEATVDSAPPRSEPTEPAEPAEPQPTSTVPPTSAPPATSPPAVATALAGPAADFLASLNELRASVGLPALATDDRLVASAAAQVSAMIDSGALSHQDLSEELAQGWSIVGENVGFGPNEPVIHQALVDSPGHRANLTHARYTHVGISVTVDANGRMWVAQVFAG